MHVVPVTSIIEMNPDELNKLDNEGWSDDSDGDPME